MVHARTHAHVCAAQEGLANVCLVGGSCTLVRAKIESSLPRKRGAALAGFDKALGSFFDRVLQVRARRAAAVCGSPPLPL